MSGAWVFTWEPLIGVLGVECTLTPLRATLTQSGDSFRGVQTLTSDLHCARNGEEFVSAAISGATIIGSVMRQEGGSIAVFFLESLTGRPGEVIIDANQTAGLPRSSGMLGVAWWLVGYDDSLPPDTLRGAWSGARQ